MHISCFERTSSVLQFTKSDTDKKIKPQGTVSEIIITLTHTNTEDYSDFLQPGDVTTPELVFNGNLGNHDVYETSENVT